MRPTTRFSIALWVPGSSPDHVRMMAAAVQPFLSGAILRPSTCRSLLRLRISPGFTWRVGSLAPQGSGCLLRQLWGRSASLEAKKRKRKRRPSRKFASSTARRQRLPKSRMGRTTSFQVAGAGGYLTTGAYDSGRLGEIFSSLVGQGSTLPVLWTLFLSRCSIGLQYGVPLESFVQKFSNLKFELAGMTDA